MQATYTSELRHTSEVEMLNNTKHNCHQSGEARNTNVFAIPNVIRCFPPAMKKKKSIQSYSVWVKSICQGNYSPSFKKPLRVGCVGVSSEEDSTHKSNC